MSALGSEQVFENEIYFKQLDQLLKKIFFTIVEGQQPKGATKKLPPPTPAKPSNTSTPASTSSAASTAAEEELLTVTLERLPGTQLGVRLGDRCSEPGVHIVEVQPGGAVAEDGRLAPMDRLLFVNGQDVRHCGIEQASALIQVCKAEVVNMSHKYVLRCGTVRVER